MRAGLGWAGPGWEFCQMVPPPGKEACWAHLLQLPSAAAHLLLRPCAEGQQLVAGRLHFSSFSGGKGRQQQALLLHPPAVCVVFESSVGERAGSKPGALPHLSLRHLSLLEALMLRHMLARAHLSA